MNDEQKKQSDYLPNTGIDDLSLSLIIDSQQKAIAPCVQRLVSVCGAWWPDLAESKLELVLDEAIRNAYEHGNLGISSEEKSRLLDSDEFEKELARRELLPEVKKKKIYIEVSCSREEFVLTIRDDGPGFDWRSYEATSLSQRNSADALHGRGLLLLHKIFDSVSYNESGNQITLKQTLKTDKQQS